MCKLVLRRMVFFLRGAIALGDHYQDDDIAYGEALFKAVDLDKARGPPRLVIGSSVEPVIAVQPSSYGNGGWAPHYEELLEDPRDECLFVNNLGVAFENSPDGPINYQLLAAHCENVFMGLRAYESDSRIRSKYEWIATYHNYVCRTFAERYSVRGDEGAEPEWMAIGAVAQRALEYLVPFEDVP